jgi:hypothetical protein
MSNSPQKTQKRTQKAQIVPLCLCVLFVFFVVILTKMIISGGLG